MENNNAIQLHNALDEIKKNLNEIFQDEIDIGTEKVMQGAKFLDDWKTENSSMFDLLLSNPDNKEIKKQLALNADKLDKFCKIYSQKVPADFTIQKLFFWSLAGFIVR